MHEHYNLFYIFLLDQQEHPMPEELVFQILETIMDRYAENVDTS